MNWELKSVETVFVRTLWVDLHANVTLATSWMSWDEIAEVFILHLKISLFYVFATLRCGKSYHNVRNLNYKVYQDYISLQ